MNSSSQLPTHTRFKVQVVDPESKFGTGSLRSCNLLSVASSTSLNFNAFIYKMGITVIRASSCPVIYRLQSASPSVPSEQLTR